MFCHKNKNNNGKKLKKFVIKILGNKINKLVKLDNGRSVKNKIIISKTELFNRHPNNSQNSKF
jgi:hypothetical protein